MRVEAKQTGMWMKRWQLIMIKAIAEDEDHDEQGNVGLVTQKAVKIRKPSLYQVLLLNDDYTPMDYVVKILKVFFDKNGEQANRLMMQVHHEGQAVVGVYTREIAETKVTLVMEDARKEGHPLQCTMRKA